MRGELRLAKTYDECVGGETKLTVVMIHGIASDSGTYGEALRYLTENLRDVRFVTFDLLGAGKSAEDDDLNYDFDDQLAALHNSIQDLKVKTPLVLVGHSMGTMIVTRYANIYSGEVAGLILISPPIYTREDLAEPAMQRAMDAFKNKVDARVRETKAFKNEIDFIILNPDNYDYFAKLAVPTTIIYGKDDKLIASFNVPGLLEKNKNLRAVEVGGGHSITDDKYVEVGKVLEEILDA